MLKRFNRHDPYFNIFHHLQDGIIIMNQHRKILLMNPSAKKLTGWKKGEHVPYCTYCQSRKLKEGEERCYLISTNEVPYFLSQMPTYEGSKKIEVEMSTALILNDEYSGDQEILLVLRDQSLKKKEEEARLTKLMLKKLIEAQEREHKRLAQELHDGVGQSLYSISLTLEAIEAHISNNKLQQYIHDAQKELERVITDVKTYSYQLRPQSLDQLGLIPTIEGLLRSWEKNLPRIKMRFKTNISTRLNPTIEVNIYRVIQEAIHNAVKYAKCQLIEIKLMLEKDRIFLTIVDDGVGFDTEKTNHGLGIKHMEERINQMNGTFWLKSNIGEGTLIHAKIPKKENVHD